MDKQEHQQFQRLSRWRIFIVAAACVLVAAAVRSQSIPPQYLFALQRSQYEVLSGDVNLDGYPDVLAKARKRFVMIDFDIPIPIPLKPYSPTFALLSDSGGTYTLVANPGQSLIGSSVWQPASHDLVFGDVLGTGNNAMLLRARTAGVPSFVIATSSSTGAPVLLQRLSASNLGVEIGGSAHSVSLIDTNRDGRADLVLRTNGLIETVFAADDSGLFAAPSNDQDRVLMAWRAFCTALDSGDIASAQQFVLSSSRPRYVEALTAMGSTVTTLSSTLSEPREISTDASFAEYAVTQTYAGSAQVHLVVFRRSGNSWLLEDF